MDTEKNYIAYNYIRSKANSNAFIQGVSGFAGFPWNILADGATLFSHYKPLMRDLRKIYGRGELEKSLIMPMLKGLVTEFLFDVANDKIMGSIPIVGIYFNAICAKTLTWRIGILIAMLSANGEPFTGDTVKNAAKLIRQVFPQTDTYKFITPEYGTFEKLIGGVVGKTQEELDNKIASALKAFE